MSKKYLKEDCPSENIIGQNIMRIGDKISLARNEKHMTQERLGKLVGVGQSYVARWEANQHIPEMENIQKLMKALEKNLDYFLEEKGGRKEIPRTFSDIVAGTINELNSNTVYILRSTKDLPIFKESDVEGTILLPRYMFNNKGDYAIHVSDDSMEPRLEKGGIVIIHAESNPNDKSIMLIKIQEGFIIRKVVKVAEDQYQFVALNHAFKTIKMSPDEFKVLGSVIGAWTRIGKEGE